MFSENEYQDVKTDFEVDDSSDIDRAHNIPCYKDSACKIPVLGPDNCCNNPTHYGRLPNGYCCGW